MPYPYVADEVPADEISLAIEVVTGGDFITLVQGSGSYVRVSLGQAVTLRATLDTAIARLAGATGPETMARVFGGAVE